MKEKYFKYELSQIYLLSTELVIKIKDNKISNYNKNILISDLLDLTEELVKYNCKKFLVQYYIKDISCDELYVQVIGVPLLKAIEFFDYKKNNNFMALWYIFIKRYFFNYLAKIKSKKKIIEKNMISYDLSINNNRSILNFIGEKDFSDNLCTSIVIAEILDKFEIVDKHGKIIKCFFIESRNIRTMEIKKILGASNYGIKERKQVQRVKERFFRFLHTNNFKINL